MLKYFSKLAQQDPIIESVNPCVPTPCGPNSRCETVNNHASCSCLPSYYGSPPNCRPECAVNSDCLSSKTCARNKCINPCDGTCGFNAICSVINHIPICTCAEGYTGDAFSYCNPNPTIRNYRQYFPIPLSIKMT